jgi:hypothetical protein
MPLSNGHAPLLPFQPLPHELSRHTPAAPAADTAHPQTLTPLAAARIELSLAHELVSQASREYDTGRPVGELKHALAAAASLVSSADRVLKRK